VTSLQQLQVELNIAYGSLNHRMLLVLAGGPRGRVKIPESAWAAVADLDAGSVTVSEIQICSMQGRKAGQYYK
jgi:hypothetical protein